MFDSQDFDLSQCDIPVVGESNCEGPLLIYYREEINSDTFPYGIFPYPACPICANWCAYQGGVAVEPGKRLGDSYGRCYVFLDMQMRQCVNISQFIPDMPWRS